MEAEHVERQSDLVFDVGMHRGEDTDFYLRKGFRVVGFEADPELADHCRRRFAAAIDDGRLVVVEGAILDEARLAGSGGSIAFHRNRDESVWGTVSDDLAELHATIDGKPSDVIRVPVVDFAAELRRHGVPHYLKIDIEGLDTACLAACRRFDVKPSYVSIESDKFDFEKLLGEFALLRELGYTAFQAVQQKDVHRQREPRPAREGAYTGHRFEPGASGLFGADRPGAWLDEDAILREYRTIFRYYRLFGDRGTIRHTTYGRVYRFLLRVFTRRQIPGWYDTHARHESATAGTARTGPVAKAA